MALFRKTIIDGEKSRTETELIVKDVPTGRMFQTAVRGAENKILIKEYNCYGGGDYSEFIRSRYSPKDGIWADLDKQLREAGF